MGGWRMSGLILGLRPANEGCHYRVTPSLIGWVQTLNQPWMCTMLGMYPARIWNPTTAQCETTLPHPPLCTLPHIISAPCLLPHHPPPLPPLQYPPLPIHNHSLSKTYPLHPSFSWFPFAITPFPVPLPPSPPQLTFSLHTPLLPALFSCPPFPSLFSPIPFSLPSPSPVPAPNPRPPSDLYAWDSKLLSCS